MKINKTTFILILSFMIFYHDNLLAGEIGRPFWTEKTAFVEGKNLFVVGVSSHIKTAEEGRQKAFDHGKIELMNYAQITDVESQGLVIETQMTYEESNKDGTLSVYRLLHVPIDKLLTIQGKIKVQRKEEEKKFNQMQTDLLVLQKTLMGKQESLETQAEATEQILKKIATTEESLSLRTKQIENKQKEIETLLSKLTGNSGGKVSNLQNKLKDVEAKLDAREQKITIIRQKILTRIKQQTNQACNNVSLGMTPRDVKAIIGNPTGEMYKHQDKNNTWSYGIAKISFDGTGIVDYVNCK